MSGADKADGKDVARVSVRILDKEYLVACPFEERSALLDAAQHLDSRMREVRDSGKVVGLDRIAVIAALNLAAEVNAFRRELDGRDSEVSRGIADLNRKLESLLAAHAAR